MEHWQSFTLSALYQCFYLWEERERERENWFIGLPPVLSHLPFLWICLLKGCQEHHIQYFSLPKKCWRSTASCTIYCETVNSNQTLGVLLDTRGQGRWRFTVCHQFCYSVTVTKGLRRTGVQRSPRISDSVCPGRSHCATGLLCVQWRSWPIMTLFGPTGKSLNMVIVSQQLVEERNKVQNILHKITNAQYYSMLL